MRYPPNRASCPAERSAIRLPSRAKSRFAALHAHGASREVGQKACYGGGTLAAGERVPTDGAAKSKRSQWGDAEVTNRIGGLDVQRGQVGPKPERVQAVLTLGATKNENVTVVFADVEAISHSDITSIGEEAQRAGNQTCRGDSLDVDGPGDQDRVAGSRRNGPQPAICASRGSRAARVVPLVCSQPVMASRTGRCCPTVPGVESTSAASPDLPVRVPA